MYIEIVGEEEEERRMVCIQSIYAAEYDDAGDEEEMHGICSCFGKMFHLKAVL